MTTYKIDPMHSEVLFKVKHLMISTVTGSFQKFDATMESDRADFTDARIRFEADIDSVGTNQPQRDTHLKSDDFFNAVKFPKLTFISTVLEKKNNSEYILNGNLTIRDITKPVSLKVTYGGKMVDGYGNEKHGFELEGTINRKDFGLKWHMMTEAGGVVAGDEVRLLLNIQMARV